MEDHEERIKELELQLGGSKKALCLLSESMEELLKTQMDEFKMLHSRIEASEKIIYNTEVLMQGVCSTFAQVLPPEIEEVSTNIFFDYSKSNHSLGSRSAEGSIFQLQIIPRHSLINRRKNESYKIRIYRTTWKH